MTRERLKEEVWKRVNEFSKYDRSFLESLYYTCVSNIHFGLFMGYEYFIVEFQRRALREIYIRVVSASIVETAMIIDLVKKEGIEENVDRICRILTIEFPQGLWEDILKEIDLYIDLMADLTRRTYKTEKTS